MAALATIPNPDTARKDPPLRAHSISEKEIAAIVRRAPEPPPIQRAEVNVDPLPVPPVKFTPAEPASSMDRIQQVAARDRAEQATVTTAPTNHRSPQAMSNRQIVSEVYNLHDAFQSLAAGYETAGSPGQRAALRDQMRPIVEREGELRQAYLGRIKQEIQRDFTPLRVGESRRIMEPRFAVADIAAGL